MFNQRNKVKFIENYSHAMVCGQLFFRFAGRLRSKKFPYVRIFVKENNHLQEIGSDKEKEGFV